MAEFSKRTTAQAKPAVAKSTAKGPAVKSGPKTSQKKSTAPRSSSLQKVKVAKPKR